MVWLHQINSSDPSWGGCRAGGSCWGTLVLRSSIILSFFHGSELRVLHPHCPVQDSSAFTLDPMMYFWNNPYSVAL